MPTQRNAPLGVLAFEPHPQEFFRSAARIAFASRRFAPRRV